MVSKDKELLLSRIRDLISRAEKTGMAHTKFLGQGELSIIAQSVPRDIDFCVEGGYPQPERGVCVFTQPDWGSYERQEIISAVRLEYRRQDQLTHRDILGAVLALGIEREVLGDITAGEGFAEIVCLEGIGDFIVQNLLKAGRVGVSPSIIPLSELSSRAEDIEEMDKTVASLRLDAVVCAAFGISRQTAADSIRGGKVKLRHLDCLDPTQGLVAGDIFSLRGYGRAKLLEIGGESKKGRIWIKLGKYL